MMNSMVHQEKLVEDSHINSRKIIICIFTSIILTIFSSSIFTLYLAYTERGINLSNWWPIHPIGLPIALTWPMRYQWFSIFLVWAVKNLILRYGGIKLFRRFIPVVLGLACGELVIAGVWVLIDSFAGVTGHVIFSW